MCTSAKFGLYAGIYNYMPGSNHVVRVYIVLQVYSGYSISTCNVIFHSERFVLIHQYRQSMCTVPSVIVFCSSLMLCFL
jgi:hypothetical protein